MDARLTVLERSGIKGDDAVTSLAIIDRVLSDIEWSEVSTVLDAIDSHAEQAVYATRIFGYDAARAAMILHRRGTA